MRPPDIIFVVLDTQRADRLGSYGYSSRHTSQSISANLDSFAAAGAIFQRAVAPAQWTIPSHASMFTGQYVSGHGVVQSSHRLSLTQQHIAELASGSGYETIGFCNNPLVGILDNGFKRGFNTFYNYGGAIPSLPKESTHVPSPIGVVIEAYTQFLRKISYPIQNFVAQSDLAFRVSLSPMLTPLWTNLAHFKGQNERSVRDVNRYLDEREQQERKRPLFLFLNLMETHLPFWPPGEHIDKVAPYVKRDRNARNALRDWNRKAFRWAAPLADPLSDTEDNVLNDLYDAEVAYQDSYLESFFEALRRRDNAENTLTIIVSDHGSGLGDHNYFGHAFVAYDELTKVPMFMHWPGRIAAGSSFSEAVSTRRIFHTIRDLIGGQQPASGSGAEEAARLSLLNLLEGDDPEEGAAITEIIPPLNFVKAVQRRKPELIERFGCLLERNALVEGGFKLIEVDGAPSELYDLDRDPMELTNVIEREPGRVISMASKLRAIQAANSADSDHSPSVKFDEDEELTKRLRGLGYVE